MSPRSAGIPVLLLLLAVGLRLPGLANPPVDIHHVRQSDTASIARNMAREGIDLLRPRIDWAGPDAGTVESEFPLYSALVALGWRVTGTHGNWTWVWARGVSLAAWLGGCLALLLWARRRLPGPWWAYAVLYALSPLGVAFSRNVQPDAVAVCLMLASIERADAASDRRGLAAWAWLSLSGLLGAGAIAIKGTVLLPVLVGAGIVAVRRRGPSRVGAAVLAILAVAPAAAWYWWAHTVLGQDGATFGILGSAAHKWGNPGLWTDPGTWRSIGGTFVMHAATPIGLAALLPVASELRSGRADLRPFALALAVGLLTVPVVAEGFALHDYYQLPLLPFLSVLAGAGGLAAARWLMHAEVSPVERAVPVVGALFLLCWSALAGAGYAGRALLPDPRIEATGTALQMLVPPGRTLVVVDRHPQSILFAADRRGFHRTRTTMEEMVWLRDAGADFLFLSATSPTFGDQGFVEQMDSAFRPMARSTDWLLYWLQPRLRDALEREAASREQAAEVPGEP